MEEEKKEIEKKEEGFADGWTGIIGLILVASIFGGWNSPRDPYAYDRFRENDKEGDE